MSSPMFRLTPSPMSGVHPSAEISGTPSSTPSPASCAPSALASAEAAGAHPSAPSACSTADTADTTTQPTGAAAAQPTARSGVTPAAPVALVTGAGSGIGQACARALLHEGWQVVWVGRRLPTLEAARREAVGADAARDARSLALACDVSDESAVAALFAAVQQRYQRLDLLFNNAGVFSAGALPDEVSAAQWRQMVDVNLNGAFYCLSHAFRLMRQQSPRGGRIVNNGSISAHVPRPGSIAYSATKHAITGLTRAAALDGRAFDIAVGQIDIGNVASDMTTAMAQGMAQPDGSVRPEARMDMQAVVQTFMAMARLPLSANMLFTTVLATGMPYLGRG